MKKWWHPFWLAGITLFTAIAVYLIFALPDPPRQSTVKVDLLATAQIIHPNQPFAALNPTQVAYLLQNDPLTNQQNLLEGPSGIPQNIVYVEGIKGLPTKRPTATTIGYTPPPATNTPIPTATPLPTNTFIPLPTNPPVVEIQQAQPIAPPIPTDIPPPTDLPIPTEIPPEPIVVPIEEGCAPSGFPVDGAQLTQYYSRWHAAVDLALSAGTPVLTTHSGTVIAAGWDNTGYGNIIKIQSGRFITAYAHLSGFNVAANDQVGRGAIIGFVGSTGNSSGPHVHYEIYLDGIPVDPMSFSDRGFNSC